MLGVSVLGLVVKKVPTDLPDVLRYGAAVLTALGPVAGHTELATDHRCAVKDQHLVHAFTS